MARPAADATSWRSKSRHPAETSLGCGDDAFDVLLSRFDLAGDVAMIAIAEVVHDIDLRDGKFARPETVGVERLVTGIAAGLDDDEARLAAASVLFQGLYDGFKRRKS